MIQLQLWGRTVLPLVMLAAVQAACPGNPWKKFGGHCYRITRTAVRWHSVRAECKTPFRKADITSVSSSKEHDFIRKLAKGQNVWLGMRSDNKRLWWTDGSPVKFNNLPGKAPHPEGRDDVVMLNSASGKWDLVQSHESHKYRGVCKMKSCQCPAGWKKWSNRCYIVVKREIGWIEARQQCKQMAPTADLVTIRNAKEDNFVWSLAAKNSQFPSWIGLNDRDKEGVHQWISGARSSYRNWFRPANSGGPPNWADCAVMLSNKKWGSGGCGTTFLRKGFICEKTICDKSDVPIPKQTVKDGELRIWNPDYAQRCPEHFMRSENKCFITTTIRFGYGFNVMNCQYLYPGGTAASISSLEVNDRAYYFAADLPVWIQYNENFTYWDEETNTTGRCALMQESGKWLPHDCEENQKTLCEIPACVPSCPKHWALFKGQCYRLVNFEMKFADAKDVCKDAGGNLTSIQGDDENDFITSLAFPSKCSTCVDNFREGVFIGAIRESDEWSWMNSDEWTFSRWFENKNSGAVPSGSCATLHLNGRWKSQGDCAAHGQKFRFICKMDACQEHFSKINKDAMDYFV